jgi:hypothetical protein
MRLSFRRAVYCVNVGPAMARGGQILGIEVTCDGSLLIAFRRGELNPLGALASNISLGGAWH